MKWTDGPTLVAEEGSEDPLRVLFDSVIRQHRISATATGYPDEWTTAFVVKRSTCTRFARPAEIDETNHRRYRYLLQLHHLLVTRRRQPIACIEHYRLLKLDQRLTAWTNETPLTFDRQRISRRRDAQNLTCLRSTENGHSLEQLVHVRRQGGITILTSYDRAIAVVLFDCIGNLFAAKDRFLF